MGIINSIVSFKDFVVSRQGQIIDLTLQHIELTVFAVVIAIIVGIPLGILISRV